MLILENETGRILIDLELIRSRTSSVVRKATKNKSFDFNLKETSDGTYRFYFKFHNCLTPSYIDDVNALLRAIRRAILKNFGIEHLVIAIEVGV